MLLLYNIFSLITLFIYLPRLLFKKGPENKLTYLNERLGISSYTNTDIWVHAVSVGETIACVPFIRILKKEFPEKKIVFSTTTYTGQKIAREKFPEVDRIMYMPWDTGLCVNRAISSLKPHIFITIETELWPVLFHRLKKIGTSIVLLNGRISLKSYKGYKRARPLIRKVLSYADFLYMQERTDAERIISLGADKSKVGIMGNFKFDIEVDTKEQLHWAEYIKGHILLAGSTHKGEEEIILDAYELIKGCREQNSGIKRVHLNLRLILAPRHPERFKEVEELLIKRGLSYVRRSAFSHNGLAIKEQSNCPDIILLDTIGELPRVFSKTAVTFIGGSLLPYGGHNILEPAYWGKPIIFGPHMDNFPIAKEFLNNSAAIMVKNPEDIARTVIELLKNPEKARLMGQKARAIIENNKGATEKAIELVRRFIGNN